MVGVRVMVGERVFVGTGVFVDVTDGVKVNVGVAVENCKKDKFEQLDKSMTKIDKVAMLTFFITKPFLFSLS